MFNSTILWSMQTNIYEFFRKIGTNITTHSMLINFAAVLFIDTEKLHDVDTSVMV